MTPAEVEQAGRDMVDWVLTLDEREVIGELAHLGNAIDNLMGQVAEGRALPGDVIGLMPCYAMVLGTLGQRAAQLLEHVTPMHDGNNLHGCTMIGRMMGFKA